MLNDDYELDGLHSEGKRNGLLFLPLEFAVAGGNNGQCLTANHLLIKEQVWVMRTLDSFDRM